MNLNYDYKLKEKKDGGNVISVKDFVKGGLLEVEKKGSRVEITTRNNLEVVRFSLPLALFEKSTKILPKAITNIIELRLEPKARLPLLAAYFLIVLKGQDSVKRNFD